MNYQKIQPQPKPRDPSWALA